MLEALGWADLLDHYGVISGPEHAQQSAAADIYLALEHYCRDTSSFVDRIELF